MQVDDFYQIARAIKGYRPFKPSPAPKQPLAAGLSHLLTYSPTLYTCLGNHPGNPAALELSIPSKQLKQLETWFQRLY